MQNCLHHESGDPGVQLNEKTEGQKSRDTVPLNAVNILAISFKSNYRTTVSVRIPISYSYIYFV
jgi:hypothetical protein